MLFQVIGAIFQGFVIAQLPFPLGQKFKSITQQGIRILDLDPSFVTSMSWCFILYFMGVDDLLRLIITDTKALEEAINTARQGNMMQGAPGGTDFNKVFAAEKENYDIINWKFELDDVEDALIAKYKKQF